MVSRLGLGCSSAGFGFSVNPKFSYSIAAKYYMVFGTRATLGGVVQTSNRLQIATVLVGMSYALNRHMTIAGSAEIGATSDSPGAHFTLRVPFS